jgi:hypothetical protein
MRYYGFSDVTKAKLGLLKNAFQTDELVEMIDYDFEKLKALEMARLRYEFY